MSIASDAPAGHTPSVTPSVSLHRKIRGRCVRSSVSSAAGSYGKRRKVSITIRLHRHAMSGVGERGSRNEKSSGGYQEILRVEAAMLRTARSGGVFGMLHRTIVRRDDLIEGTADLLAGRGSNENGRTLSRSAAAKIIYRRIVRLRFIVELGAAHLHPLGVSNGACDRARFTIRRDNDRAVTDHFAIFLAHHVDLVIAVEREGASIR
jgi:hypothetical protein